MINAGLSPDQFIIVINPISVNPIIRMFVDQTDEAGIELGVQLFMTLTIEDISGLEPGEMGELAARFRYLCSIGTNINELRKWVLSLSGSDKWAVERTNKEQLCQVLRVKYGF